MVEYFSMFSGIGGFEKGIGKRGECIGYSEIDKYAKGIYRYNFPDHTNWGDATKIETERLPDFDMLVGGSPCQSFSIAGKLRGFADTRGTLFFDFARILRDKKPEYFIFENVRNLVSHDKGRTIQTVLQTFADAGYTFEWSVLNSKAFGVPQNRERIYIVGYLGGYCGEQIFPLKGRPGPDLKELTKGVSQADRVYDTSGACPTIPTSCGGRHEPKIFDTPRALTETRTEEAKRIRRQMQKDQGRDWSPRRGKKLVPRKDEISNCLTTGQTKEHLILKGKEIRKLTPVECERLQGFPDDYTKTGVINGENVPISDTQRYKCIGNAVTVNVVNAIIKRMDEVIL